MDPVELSIFSNRLSAVCDEMGAVLQRAAFSPNIRDRLDFSCAVFDVQGELCAQAAHIPVHLGSMAYAMRDIVKNIEWHADDVIVVNDPFLGGTHLPDVTLISPVFVDDKLQGFVANRAHHADIGGHSPGSMPISKTLDEEGIIIPPQHLLKAGELNQELMQTILASTRNKTTGEGDFAAQISANKTGMQRLAKLIDQFGQTRYQELLSGLNDYAETIALHVIKTIPDGQYSFSDVMDDDGLGNELIKIQLTLTVEHEHVHVDFSGTDVQTQGNINCPLSVVAAAVYYVFRCLMPDYTPACAGSFRPVTISAPEGCLLNAKRPAAVAAGNVETSTRVVDVVMGALAQAIPEQIPAASHGSMNNLAMGSVGGGMGDAAHNHMHWDYYETMGGGMGAGQHTDGLSGIQTHMTNTRNTPVEVMESSYPVRVHRYALRHHSGGKGKHDGGDGLIREIEFTDQTTVTLLSERRSISPWGLNGGLSGRSGVNKINGKEMPAKFSTQLQKGDRLSIETAGGGGWVRLSITKWKINMCGLCGEIRFDKQALNPEVIKKMLPKLARRGPDFEGTWQHESIQFGHRRLAIIDLSERSNQPLHDAQLGLTIVFNGAIYNYPELRQQFIDEGYKFQSEGDTEVILKAYHKWGEQCPTHLDGMFAFAIWDNNKKQLFVARDRMGIKPFYFSRTDQYFRFASNIQALLATGEEDTSIDKIGLHHQFTLHAVIPAPHTILNGIKKLEPGTYMTIQVNGEVSTHRYWHLTATRPAEKYTDEEWTERIHDQLRDAVRKRLMVADVPVGVLLSGGLDSSLLVALLAESDVKDLLTFSIGFEDQPEEKGSEFEFSDQVVERYQTQHHKIHIANDQVLKRLPEAIQYMSEPMFGQDAVAFYLLSEQVSKQVKVVQSGQGADEVFAGYFWYPKMVEDINGEYTDRFARYYFDREHDEYLEMVAKKYQGEDYTRQKVDLLLNEPDADEFIDRVLRMDVTTLVVDDPVKRVDNMTMAFGLEARVPFLDYRLVELAAQMPPHMKLASGGKHVLKEISRGLLPDAVIDRPKGYFPMPALKYVRGEFLDFMRAILLSDTARQRGLYQPTYVEKLLSEPDQHFTRLQGSKLWHLALLELWLQTHLA